MTTQRIEMVEPDQPEGRGFASRKFVIALLTVAAATALRLADQIDAAHWVDVAKWVVGLYLTGNVGQAAVDAWRGRR